MTAADQSTTWMTPYDGQVSACRYSHLLNWLAQSMQMISSARKARNARSAPFKPEVIVSSRTSTPKPPKLTNGDKARTVERAWLSVICR